MKKITIAAIVVAIALIAGVVVVSAQGLICPKGYVQPNPNATGPGQGAGYARMGLPCPYGNTPQVVGAGYGRLGWPCPYGYTQPNPNAGGWWTRVNPTTPEQKAFVDKVTDLHNQIRQKNFELAQLRATNGDPNKIAVLEKDIENLRSELHDYLTKNIQIRQQLGRGGWAGSAGNRGWRGGRNYANNPQVPYQCCINNPDRCQDCPYYDECTCPYKQVRTQQQNQKNGK